MNFKSFITENLAVWLDDERPMPPAYDTHVKSAEEAINLLKSGQVDRISLDHDLGTDVPTNTGYHVAKWIEEHAWKYRQGDSDGLAPVKVAIHTANPVGRQNMAQALRNAVRYWQQV